ncbi:MAG: tRNA (guanosine(46)-N7)-methyltransferase TrmB [Gammaproteobacteria bacterium]|jgi:tRNA (guanine-N7-)-methyltransferase
MDQTPETPTPRRIRSFVLRAGRITPAQQRALEELWPRLGIDLPAAAATADGDPGRPLDLDAVFGRAAPRVLEIGFGNGENLLALAAADPARDFIGVEVHRAGVGHLLLRTAEAGLTNLRVVCHDAVEVLERHIAPGSLDEVLVLFPDPWHKKRHHKRRLMQPAFVDLVVSRLRPGGRLQLATDWEPYARQMLEVLSACPALRNLAPAAGTADAAGVEPGFVPRPAWRALTRFERRGHRLGHGVWDLSFEKV